MSIELQMDILDAFVSYPESYMSLNAIAKRIERAYPQVHTTAKKMIEEKILSSMVIGRSIACTPNLKNPLAILLLSLSQAKKSEDYLSKNKDFRQMISQLTVAIGNETSSFLLSKKKFYILTDMEQKKIIQNYCNELIKQNSKLISTINEVYCESYSLAITFRGKEDEFIILHGYEQFFSHWGERNE